MKNVFVGNMSFQTTETELRAAFEPYGEIARIQIITDRDTGQARGFGFVEMASDEEAVKAIAGLNGTQLDGRSAGFFVPLHVIRRKNPSTGDDRDCDADVTRVCDPLTAQVEQRRTG